MAQDAPLSLRSSLDAGICSDPGTVLAILIETACLTERDRSPQAAGLVPAIRGSAAPGTMEVFLTDYGLSTDEGMALVCLAEPLLRVPDAEPMVVLIEDKMTPFRLGPPSGSFTPAMVNAMKEIGQQFMLGAAARP